MKSLKWVVALLLLSPLVFGQATKTFTWTPPTEYTDNTPLPNSDLAEYRIYCNGQLLATVPNVPVNTNSYATDLPAGTYTCTATAVTVLGVESAESNPANFTVDPGVPNPPTQFVLQ